ncbi:MAG TPA: hypothetical protein VFW03_15680 [Gemmatimonadaceae bacterium]|nr:hypothetical protein [Gemmatimonadaceae bacterium]
MSTSGPGRAVGVTVNVTVECAVTQIVVAILEACERQRDVPNAMSGGWVVRASSGLTSNCRVRLPCVPRRNAGTDIATHTGVTPVRRRSRAMGAGIPRSHDAVRRG